MVFWWPKTLLVEQKTDVWHGCGAERLVIMGDRVWHGEVGIQGGVMPQTKSQAAAFGFSWW